MKTLQDILFLFFGTIKRETIFEDDYGDITYSFYSNNDFKIHVAEHSEKAAIGVDLISCYDKPSKMPVHFVVDLRKDLSSRKKKRIFEALNFLLKNEKDAGGFFGEMPGFDDLGSHKMFEIYQ